MTKSFFLVALAVMFTAGSLLVTGVIEPGLGSHPIQNRQSWQDENPRIEEVTPEQTYQFRKYIYDAYVRGDVPEGKCWTVITAIAHYSDGPQYLAYRPVFNGAGKKMGLVCQELLPTVQTRVTLQLGDLVEYDASITREKILMGRHLKLKQNLIPQKRTSLREALARRSFYLTELSNCGTKRLPLFDRSLKT